MNNPFTYNIAVTFLEFHTIPFPIECGLGRCTPKCPEGKILRTKLKVRDLFSPLPRSKFDDSSNYVLFQYGEYVTGGRLVNTGLRLYAHIDEHGVVREAETASCEGAFQLVDVLLHVT